MSIGRFELEESNNGGWVPVAKWGMRFHVAWLRAAAPFVKFWEFVIFKKGVIEFCFKRGTSLGAYDKQWLSPRSLPSVPKS